MDSSVCECALADDQISRGEPTELSSCATGSVSIGFMHATPGEIKSLRSSAERMALMMSQVRGARGVAASANLYKQPWRSLVKKKPNRSDTGGKQVKHQSHEQKASTHLHFKARSAIPMRGERKRPETISQSRNAPTYR